MTNGQVSEGFTEVYNRFWNRYKNNVPHKDSEEWDRIHAQASSLRKNYPFLASTVTDLEVELDQRMRRGERHDPVSGSGGKPA